MRDKVRLLLDNHLFKCVGGLIGFTVAFLIITIGFFETVLILLLTCIGVFVGARWDRDEGIRNIMDKILPRGNDSDTF